MNYYPGLLSDDELLKRKSIPQEPILLADAGLGIGTTQGLISIGEHSSQHKAKPAAPVDYGSGVDKIVSDAEFERMDREQAFKNRFYALFEDEKRKEDLARYNENLKRYGKTWGVLFSPPEPLPDSTTKWLRTRLPYEDLQDRKKYREMWQKQRK